MLIQRSRPGSLGRRGYTLIEVVVVITIMTVMISVPVPLFLRTVEQSKLDIATGQLRAIWSAERFYRLEHGGFGSLGDLSPSAGGDDDLIGPLASSPDFPYTYSISVSEDGQSFVASAAHSVQPHCQGTLSIDQTGTLTNTVTYDGQPMTPSLEPGP